MLVPCPHCSNPVDVDRSDANTELSCPSCGSTFHLEDMATIAWQPVGSKTIGRFEILGTVGQGGFGTVYKARDRELDRIVALKLPRTGNLAGPQELDRFLREARSVAQLQHPGIVPVHEVAQHNAMPFLVSEFVEGITLADLLSGGRPAFRESAELVAQIADALQYAHDRGVVHRDIKPSNIMLERGAASRALGVPRLMDFGLAKRDAGEVTVTIDGQVLGTPTYMSPELAAGQAHQVDGRSDIYSLGVILYQLLTGEPPFRGTARMLVHQVQHEEPRPPRRLNDRIPRDLETIALKALAKEPSRRYASARALAEDLRRWLRQEPIAARPVGRVERGWRWCRRNPLVAGLSAAVVVSLLAGTVVAMVLAIQADSARRDAEDNALAEAAAKRATQAALIEAQLRRKQYQEALDAQTSLFLTDVLGRQPMLTEEHRAFLRGALKSYERLAADAGDDADTRRRVARAYHGVGQIRFHLGEYAEAEQAYRTALAMQQAVGSDPAAPPADRLELAGTRNGLGVVLDTVGRGKEAEGECRAAQALFGSLAKEVPQAPVYVVGLAHVHHNLGRMLEKAGRFKEAEAEHRAALALRKPLAEAHAKMVGYQFDLARSHSSLGRVVQRRGKPKDAEEHFRAAMALQQALADEFPTVPAYRQELARSHNHLGILFQTRQPDKAETEYRAAIALQKPLAADFPIVPVYRQELAQSHNNLGIVLKNVGRLDEAEIEYRAALALHQQLAETHRKVPAHQRAVAQTRSNLGILLKDMKRFKDAEIEHTAAVAGHRQLAQSNPTVPDYQNELAGALVNLAGLHQILMQFPTARLLLDEALPHHRAALKGNPLHPVYRQFYRNNRSRQTQVLLALGEHAAAATVAEEFAAAAVDPVDDLCKAAGYVARCIPCAEKDVTLRESKRAECTRQYGERAMALLHQAVHAATQAKSAGLDAAQLRQDSDLAPLRDRADFQKLLAQLEKK